MGSACFGSAKGNRVQRDAKTASASSIPRARLLPGATMELRDDGALTLTFRLNVAAPSRFELRGHLIRQRSGQATTRRATSSAALLDSAIQVLTLVFDAKTMAQAKVAEPYRIRDLTLIDQVDLSTIEIRRAGLRLAGER